MSLQNTKNRRSSYANANDLKISAVQVNQKTILALKKYLNGLSDQEFAARTGMKSSEFWAVTDSEVMALDEWNKITRWREAVMEVLAGVCSILGAVEINFNYTADGLACTNGEDVFIGLRWFNEEILPAVLNDNVYEAVDAYAIMKGLAYHELSHVRFTARFNHEPTKTIRSRAKKAANAIDSNLFTAYNILEDMRIERLFVGEFAPAKVLFTNLVMRYIVDEVSKKKKDLNGVYTMIAGRDYLKKSLRKQSRDTFIKFVDSLVPNSGAKVANKVDALVSEYCAMTFPRDQKRAIEICEEYSKLLVMLRDGGVNVQSSSASESTLMREWEADHPYWVDKAHDTAGDIDLDFDDTDLPSKAGSVSDEAESPEGNSSAPGNEQNDSESATSSGGGSSSEVSERVVVDVDDLLDSISKERDRAATKSNDIAKEDLKSINKKVNRDGAGRDMSVDSSKTVTHSVNGNMRLEAKKLKQYIRTVFSEIEPEYVGGHSSGRLNVRDLMSARGSHTDVFDVWRDLGEGADFEVVIAIDTSGSMNHELVKHDMMTSLNAYAHRSVWAIHRAFSELEIPVTVIQYDSEAQVVISPSSNCNPMKWMMANTTGATCPHTAFAIAKHVFKKSNAEHKLLITLTDGDWNYSCLEGWQGSLERQSMSEFQSMGIHSVLVTYERAGSEVPVFSESGKHNGHDKVVRLHPGQHSLLAKEVGKAIVELTNKRLLAG